jgi:predicted Zn-dependent peptidase
MTTLHVACERRTTSSGLRVVVAPQSQLHTAHVALYVRVGSRFETAQDNGLSHFLEHMLYRGTPRLASAHAVNLAFERLGGSLYAATQTDSGVFSVSLPPENLARATELFAEVVTQPIFSDIEVEKGIVCEEILEDLDDEGRQIDPDNLSRALVYPSHPLGFTITGDEAHVRSFDVAALRRHHARHYTTANSVLAFSGAIDPDRAFELAERVFAPLPRGQRVTVAPPAHAQRKPRVSIVENVSSQTELRVCFRAIPEPSPMRPALDALMRVIHDGMSTRLYRRICDDQGLCYDVSGGYDGYEDDGVIDFAAGVVHERTAKVTREILALVTELASEGPTEDELLLVKQRHAWELASYQDACEDTAAFFAGGELFERYQTFDERKAELDRVTRDDVVAVAREIARPERLSVVAVGLLEDGEDARLRDVVTGFKAVR